MNLRGHRALVVALGVTLFGTACSGGGVESVAATIESDAAAIAAEVAATEPVAADGAETAPADSQTELPEPVAASVPLPDVEVYDLKTGATAGLASFVRPGATLVWFWAPH